MPKTDDATTGSLDAPAIAASARCPPDRPAAGGLDRRRWLRRVVGGATALALSACGGGGGGNDNGDDGGDDGGGQGGGRPSGTLYYRNNSEAALLRFGDGTRRSFDAGSAPLIKCGMGVSPEGQVYTALQGDNDGFAMAVFDADGRRVGTRSVPRPWSFQLSTPVWNAAGDRMALAVDEPVSDTDDERIARTLVLDWPAGRLLATVDRYEEPVWAGNELLVQSSEDGRLRAFARDLSDLGVIDGVVASTQNAGYDASRDGRWIVYRPDGTDLRIEAYDRRNGRIHVLAEREFSKLFSPCLSPDGRWLALIAFDQRSATQEFWTYLPHLIPFDPGTTVDANSEDYALDDTLVECDWRMAWAP